MKVQPYLGEVYGRWIGYAAAASIVCLWSSGLYLELTGQLNLSPWLAIPAQTFLQTGLFITAHDAVHGNISQRTSVNRLIGRAALWLYGGLSYDTILARHFEHHRQPVTAADPDFCSAENPRFLPWYFGFMARYQSQQQLGRSAVWLVTWFMALVLFSISPVRLIEFYIVPLIASSLQLFTFGIFLPHRPGTYSQPDRHQSRSSQLPRLVSFFVCYHFDYHWEHHQYPSLPWYRLPEVKHASLSGNR